MTCHQLTSLGPIPVHTGPLEIILDYNITTVPRVAYIPINMPILTTYLRRFPDQAFAQYVANGLSSGFNIGYAVPKSHLRSSHRNHPSAQANPMVVDERISAELEAGRLLGPMHITTEGCYSAHRPRRKNKWRLICDLSSPIGHSVNDGISPELCSLHYASVNDAVAIIQRLGRGTCLIKVDVKDAYRIVSVHPAVYNFLGFQWKNKTYI